MGTAVSKDVARADAFARRKVAHEAASGPGAATRHLLGLLEPYRGRVISGNLPIRTEIDPVPAMTALALDSRVVVPVIPGPATPLLFRRWIPGGTLIEGPFGALVPETGEDLEPDALIVPLLAFHRNGHRLGYGGGYYDRTLARLRMRGEVFAIGFAYAGQETDDMPLEPTDARLDAIVTEREVIPIDP
jgi:5-formyltetrahydrofolate cyclo-ligase